MPSLPLTREQFDHARLALAAEPSVNVNASSSTEGSICTPDVELGYHFTGSALDLTITRRKSFKAKLASDTAIADRIAVLLRQA